MTDRTLLRTRSTLYHYTAHVTDVYDGDTITVDIDMGLGVWRHGERIRFWKVNTPELRGPERARGLEVRTFVRSLILDKTILLRTILDKRGRDRSGKFGRLLGEILVDDADQGMINVNEELLVRGFAVPFGEDGSAVPVPSAVQAAGAPALESAAQAPAMIACPYCGVLRALQGRLLLACPNCLDGAKTL